MIAPTLLPFEPGDFVEVRGRHWLVESLADDPNGLSFVNLSCISDDAQGESLQVIWDAEVGARVLDDDGWNSVGKGSPDDASVFAAHLRTVRWRSASAADRDLLQAPFRAGIRLDAYQLLPLQKALRLPRVNLLIADDVGLGKTVEAGLIARELLLRRRIDYIVIVAPPNMTLQWRDELESKFGLSFEILDRERIGELRRQRGFSVNPWTTGSRFILSHRLLVDETYAAGLRDVLGEFRPRALFILDEAHHAAPSAGMRYAISSQLTRAVREIAERFEHRLFLTATPHNGHSNSFSALLEMLDPQRFTRGVEVRPKDLEPVMVRRLKADLRRLGENFPERIVEPIQITGLPDDAPELVLDRMLADYGELRRKRIERLPARQAALAVLVFVGLQQRLLSSIAAFARTLKVHRESLQRVLDGHLAQHGEAAVQAFVSSASDDDSPGLIDDENELAAAIEADETSVAEAATEAGAVAATTQALQAELAWVDGMLAYAERSAPKPDARARWLATWIKANLLEGGRWNRRRLLIFTEYEDTRRWLERRLGEALADTDRIDERIGVFTGATGADRREEVKRAFNADPDSEPLRILICTDAAREGINLQTRCADLIHLDLPWNPSRLEQRNGRIDRKLQAAPRVYCRYFHYAQREADIVLTALVRKTETIRNQLGSAGQVIEDRIAQRLSATGIARGQASAMASEIETERDTEAGDRARRELDDGDGERRARLLKEQQELQKALERSRARVGVDAGDLQRVAEVALARSGIRLADAEAEPVGRVTTFRLDPANEAFAREAGWDAAFDDLRIRPRKRGERLTEWRRRAPVRAIAFEPPVLEDGRDATDVVQVHLEHRLLRRLLARFISQGFQSALSRFTVIGGSGGQSRVILLGRLALYGQGATRLHEEVILVTALWTDSDRAKRPLRALGDGGEETTLAQLEVALREASPAPAEAHQRIGKTVHSDVGDLLPTLEAFVTDRLKVVAKQLVQRGETEARSLTDLLQQQRARIAKAQTEFDERQLSLDLVPGERREREADRRHWAQRLARLDRELREEPERLRRSYEIRSHRLEPIGLVYLWPGSR